MKNKRPISSFPALFFLYFCCFLLFATIPFTAYAQESLDEDAQISLLTVYPRDKAVYAIFGHTAIRVKSEKQDMDSVYNYGYFDSSKPNFIFNFVRGETIYMLGVDEFEYFIYRYALDNSHIEEQVLQLTTEEKRDIFAFLNHNALPENREYRYDFFFDNCTTRPRDIVEDYTKGKISYPRQQAPTTLRRLVHECTKPFPWLEYGIDLVIGSGADSTVTLRTELFLPLRLMETFDDTRLITDSVSYPLVERKVTLLRESEEGMLKDAGTSLLPSPHVAAILLLVFIIGITLAGYKRKRLFRGIDVALFAAAGVAGIIVAFISFVSTHPCTSDNYNIIWLHPLHLVAAACFLIKSPNMVNKWYHLINFVVLSAFLLFWRFLPQEIPGAGVWMASCLWFRSGYNIVFPGMTARKKKIRG